VHLSKYFLKKNKKNKMNIAIFSMLKIMHDNKNTYFIFVIT